MRMDGQKTVFIEWSLRGRISGQEILIDFVEQLKFNLLTARVEEHMQSWKMVRAPC